MPTLDPLPPGAPDPLIAIEKADLAIAERAGALQHHPLVEGFGSASEIADQPPLIALSAATLAAGVLLRRPATAATGLRMLSAHLLATGVKTVVKRSVDRTRPRVLAEEGRYLVQKGRHNDPRYNSFPSGHAAGAIAVTEAVAHGYPRAAWPLRTLTLAIAAVQVPRRTHFPSDLVAGAAIGLASERAVRFAEAWWRARNR